MILGLSEGKSEGRLVGITDGAKLGLDEKLGSMEGSFDIASAEGAALGTLLGSGPHLL